MQRIGFRFETNLSHQRLPEPPQYHWVCFWTGCLQMRRSTRLYVCRLGKPWKVFGEGGKVWGVRFSKSKSYKKNMEDNLSSSGGKLVSPTMTAAGTLRRSWMFRPVRCSGFHFRGIGKASPDWKRLLNLPSSGGVDWAKLEDDVYVLGPYLQQPK